MPFEMAELTPLANWAAEFMLVIARLSFVIFLMPGIGEQAVPTRVRMVLLLGIALAMLGSGIDVSIPFEPFSGYLGALLTEILIGFTLGVSLRLAIWMLSIAGSVIAQCIGLSQFLGVALEHEAQTITANILSMSGAVILLTANFHVAAFVSFLGLYTEVPTGDVSALDQEFFVNGLFATFETAITLAWPFVAVNLIYNICLGFINKALPQMMVAFVGAPFMVGSGLFLLTAAVASLLFVWKTRMPDLIGWM